MARNDLEELHQLAAIISDDVAEYRQRRRQRTDALIASAIQAKTEAPVRRRRRHRDVAALVVVVLAAGATTAVVTVEHHRQPAPLKPHPVIKSSNPNVIAGIAASRSISSEGRTPDVFACQEALVQQFGAASTGLTQQQRTTFIKACASGG